MRYSRHKTHLSSFCASKLFSFEKVIPGILLKLFVSFTIAHLVADTPREKVVVPEENPQTPENSEESLYRDDAVGTPIEDDLATQTCFRHVMRNVPQPGKEIFVNMNMYMFSFRCSSVFQYRCHGLRLYPVCVCNTVRLGQDTT